jgi:hypothetical protein
MRRPYLLISGAWLLHAVAWFLPVIKGCVSIPRGLPGLEALCMSFGEWPWPYSVLGPLSAVTTIVFIVGSPWIVLRGSRSVWRASAWATAVTFIVNAHWLTLFDSEKAGLRIGYFLWWLSFSLLAVGLFDLARQNMVVESKERVA